MKTKNFKYKNLVKRYILKYQPIMKLRDWKINIVEDKEDDKTAYLRVTFDSIDYKEATIYIGSRFSELNDEEKEQAVVHELSHIVMAGYDQTNTDIINLFVELINKVRESSLESVVDNFADGIVNAKRVLGKNEKTNISRVGRHGK